MDADLRQHFDRAVRDEPGLDASAMARAAITDGGRVRRRRRQTGVAAVAAGVVLVLGGVAGVNRLTAPAATSPVTVAAAMMPVAAPSCSAEPVDSDATDVALFLSDAVTEQQRIALRSALDGDARVAAMVFESNEQAYERFRRVWADSPDFVAAVEPGMVPASFRVRLTDPAQYAAFRARYATAAGVSQVVGRVCPPSAPVGGVL